MKTQVSSKIGLKKFETLSIDEMANIAGGKGKDKKDVKVKISALASIGPREKDVFDPDEH